ncbi:MAG: lytic transglycosylase domain-containing protein [Patescibacteria group bacterium]
MKAVSTHKSIRKLSRITKRIKKRNAKKLAVLGMVVQMSFMTSAISIVPVSAHNNDTSVASSELSLSKKAMVFDGANSIKIVSGNSNDYVQKRQIVAQVAVSKTVSTPAPSLTELRLMYQEVESRHGIAGLAKALEAVHQVESGKSWDTSKRSYAGATGPMQFMPSTFRYYCKNSGAGSDITSGRDSIFAAGNLLAASYINTGSWNGAFYNYNHSTSYVNKVLGVMNSI